jgi:hypothetical protein
MGTKRTSALVAKAKRLRIEGLDDRAIAEVLSKEQVAKGGKTISKSAIGLWLGPKSARRDDVRPSAAPAEPVLPAPRPVDEGPMTPEELATWLGVELRQAQVDADACRAARDEPGTSRALRRAAGMASMLQRIHARAGDDGDFVRVRQVDLAAAAEKARSKLHDLVARLADERTR